MEITSLLTPQTIFSCRENDPKVISINGKSSWVKFVSALKWRWNALVVGERISSNACPVKGLHPVSTSDKNNTSPFCSPSIPLCFLSDIIRNFPWTSCKQGVSLGVTGHAHLHYAYSVWKNNLKCAASPSTPCIIKNKAFLEAVWSKSNFSSPIPKFDSFGKVWRICNMKKICGIGINPPKLPNDQLIIYFASYHSMPKHIRKISRRKYFNWAMKSIG